MSLQTKIEAKIQDPISIKLSKDSKVILGDKFSDKDYPLVPGAMINGSHYGFILIVDYNGKQTEYVYPTQCKIDAIGMENGFLKVFENGKKLSWLFDKVGVLKHSPHNDFTDEFKSKVDVVIKNVDIFTEEPIVKNPISIKISRKPEESMILKDEVIGEDYPLFPGAMIGTENYGFVLIIDTDKGQKEVVYPTQNRIQALGMKEWYGDIEIHEEGKYHPWLFTYEGKFKEKASYNEHSRRDRAFIEDCYGLNSSEVEEYFTVQKKK